MITLIRHGQVELDEQRRWRTDELRELIACYDRSPVLPPKDELTDHAARARILCSDLRRSKDSAHLIFGRCDESSPLFREAELPDLPPLPFHSAKALLAIARVSWCLGRAKNCESFSRFRARCAKAADMLVEQHAEHQMPIVLVGHAFVNRYIARALRRKGWTGPSSPSAQHWERTSYHSPIREHLR